LESRERVALIIVTIHYCEQICSSLILISHSTYYLLSQTILYSDVKIKTLSVWRQSDIAMFFNPSKVIKRLPKRTTRLPRKLLDLEGR